MKNILIAMFSVVSLSATAHEIMGTQMLKGSLEAKVIVESIKTTCKVQVDKVKNLMEEDSFGNPAYKAQVEVSLKGGGFMSDKKVRFERKVTMTNLFNEGNGTIVKDLEYHSPEGLTVSIDEEGRLKRAKLTYKNTLITCNF